jgi:hypothetical protein
LRAPLLRTSPPTAPPPPTTTTTTHRHYNHHQKNKQTKTTTNKLSPGSTALAVWTSGCWAETPHGALEALEPGTKFVSAFFTRSCGRHQRASTGAAGRGATCANTAPCGGSRRPDRRPALRFVNSVSATELRGGANLEAKRPCCCSCCNRDKFDDHTGAPLVIALNVPNWV